MTKDVNDLLAEGVDLDDLPVIPIDTTDAQQPTSTPTREIIPVNIDGDGVIRDKTWQALLDRYEFWAVEDEPVVLRGDRGRKTISRPTTPYMLDMVADVVAYSRMTVDGEGNIKHSFVRAPRQIVEAMRARAPSAVKTISRITHAPVVSRHGRIVADYGYDATSMLYIDTTLSIPPIPEKPTEADVDAARSTILDVIADFPYVNDASRAHTVAAMMQPFVRELIDGPTPLYAIKSTMSRTGKSLLASTIAEIAVGFTPSGVPLVGKEDEKRKQLGAKLFARPEVIMFDNVSRMSTLRSSALASALTESVYRDRLLGESREVAVPVTCLWIATGNNLTLSDEIFERSVVIELDANTEHPGERTGFRHALPRYAIDHRSDIVHAILTIVKAWLADGRQPGTSDIRMGRYESWVAVMGGLLETARIPGLLGNRGKLREVMDTDSDEIAEFVEEWAEQKGDSKVQAVTLLGIAERVIPHVIRNAATEIGKARSLSYWLKNNVGVIRGGYRIETVKMRNRGNMFFLVIADGQESQQEVWG